MTGYLKPLPTPDEFSGPYWQGCAKHELLIQRCQNCGSYQDFPRGMCYRCSAENLEWVRASGRGTVYSFSTIYRAPTPEFADDVPYTIALIELEEGIRMMSNIIDCAPEDIKIGMPVEVVFDKVTPEITLPKFKPQKKLPRR